MDKSIPILVPDSVKQSPYWSLIRFVFGKRVLEVPTPYNISNLAVLRLAVNEVRRLAVGGILWLGLCCNKFSKMFLGT